MCKHSILQYTRTIRFLLFRTSLILTPFLLIFSKHTTIIHFAHGNGSTPFPLITILRFLRMPVSTRKNELRKPRRKLWKATITVSSPTHNNSFNSQPSSSFGRFENIRTKFSFKLTSKSIKPVRCRRNTSASVKGQSNITTMILKMTPDPQSNARKFSISLDLNTVNTLIVINWSTSSS